MLKLFLFALFFCFASSARLDLINNGNVFRISLNYTAEVTWTLNGAPFQHLEQLSPTCPDQGTPVSQGNGVWSCGPYDSLNALKLSCTAGKIVKYVGGAYQCVADNDIFGALNCSAQQVAKFISGVWTCAPDMDTWTSLNLTCTNGQVLQYASGRWGCGPATAIVDSDVITQITGCVAGNLLKYNATSKSFYCAPDADYVPSGCADGNVVVFQNGVGVCQADSDTALSLTGCGPSAPFIKLVNGVWVCRSTYFTVVGTTAAPSTSSSGEILVLRAVDGDLGTTSTGATVINASYGEENAVSSSLVAPVLPVAGTIYSTRVTLYNFFSQDVGNKTINVNVFVNGNVVSTTPFVVSPGSFTTTFTTPALSVSFAAGSSITASITTTTPNLLWSNGAFAFVTYLII